MSLIIDGDETFWERYALTIFIVMVMALLVGAAIYLGDHSWNLVSPLLRGA